MSQTTPRYPEPAGSLPCSAKAFLGARAGAVTMMFALAVIPIMLILGVAVDYSRATTARARLQGAVDAAALQVGTQTGMTAAQHQLLASNVVKADLGNEASSLNVNVTESDLGNGSWKVTATASLQTTIMKLANIPAMTLNASAQSSSQATTTSGNPLKNINMYFLVDASQSMGVGANESDRQTMSSSSLQCSFACHSGVAAYTTTTDACRGPSQSVTVTDGETYAHEQGVTLRIDAIKTALANAIAQAQQIAAANGLTLQIALYSFDNSFHTLHSLTNNWSALTTAVNTLDIAGANQGGGGGTNLQTALQQVQSLTGTNGDGSSASSPLNYVVLISDGLYDNANALASTYVPAPAPVCTTQWQCLDDNGNQCGVYQQGWGDGGQQQGWGDGGQQHRWGDGGNHNQCGGWNNDWNNCQPQQVQTCTTTYSGATIQGNPTPGASNSLYNGNVGNIANANNVDNYSLDANLNLLTGDQNNADHWSVGAAQTGTLCYPNATTGSNPIGQSPYVTPTGAANPPPCIPDPVNGGNFELAPINPSWCQPLSNAGAKVVTLYTTYIMDNPKPTNPTDSQYYDWRVYYMQNYQGVINGQNQSFLTSLQTGMASCATSTNYAYQATTSKDIQTALSSIMSSLTTTPLHLAK